MFPTLKWNGKKVRRVLLWTLLAVWFYPVSFFLVFWPVEVFEVFQPDLPPWETGARYHIALDDARSTNLNIGSIIGPKPSLLFCDPLDDAEDMPYYDRRQWPFVVYAPLVKQYNNYFIPKIIQANEHDRLNPRMQWMFH